MPSIKQLKAKLLTFGGERFQVEWFLKEELSPLLVNELFRHGKLLEATKVKFVPMEPSNCHENCETLNRKKGWHHYFGFALSQDDIWRVHSWCMNKNGIVETTEPRVKYFGICFPQSN